MMTRKQTAWEKWKAMRTTGTAMPPTVRRHATLTRWYAREWQGGSSKRVKRQCDRWCHALIEGENVEVRELPESEISEHEPCQLCAG